MLEFHLRFVAGFVPLLLGNELVVGFVSFVGFVTTGLGKTLFVEALRDAVWEKENLNFAIHSI